MSTIATGLVMMRWELLSAVMMFFASQLNVVCRKTSRNGMAFMFSSFGPVYRLLVRDGPDGHPPYSGSLHPILVFGWDRYVDVVSTMPVDWPMP